MAEAFLTELNDDEFKLHVVAVANETARRLSLVKVEHVEHDDENLIGPDEACALLGMSKRTLYRLEAAGRLPFARSRSQKDRAYDKPLAVKWRGHQRIA